MRELAQLRVELAALSTQETSIWPAISAACLLSHQVQAAAILRSWETEADLAEVRTIEGRVGDMEGVVRWIPSYADMEEKAKEVTSARTRAKQLADKYAATFAKDEADRAFIRESVTQLS